MSGTDRQFQKKIGRARAAVGPGGAASRGRKEAFSLVELLTVVGLIGLLLTLTFPFLNKARDRAAQATCLSNLRQCHCAITMYAGDHDFRTPRGHGGDWTANCWRGYILPYHNTPSIYLCPRAPLKARRSYSRANYGINAYVGEVNGGSINLTTIREPNATIYLGENGDGDWVVEPIGGTWNTVPGAWYACHGAGSQVAWIDGHVTWLSTEDAHANGFYMFRVNK